MDFGAETLVTHPSSLFVFARFSLLAFATKSVHETLKKYLILLFLQCSFKHLCNLCYVRVPNPPKQPSMFTMSC